MNNESTPMPASTPHTTEEIVVGTTAKLWVAINDFFDSLIAEGFARGDENDAIVRGQEKYEFNYLFNNAGGVVESANLVMDWRDHLETHLGAHFSV